MCEERKEIKILSLVREFFFMKEEFDFESMKKKGMEEVK